MLPGADWRNSDSDGEYDKNHPDKLIEAINSGEISPKQATSRLRLVPESVAENHSEYRVEFNYLTRSWRPSLYFARISSG